MPYSNTTTTPLAIREEPIYDEDAEADGEYNLAREGSPVVPPPPRFWNVHQIAFAVTT
jgi:hypothetical protein